MKNSMFVTEVIVLQICHWDILLDQYLNVFYG